MWYTSFSRVINFCIGLRFLRKTTATMGLPELYCKLRQILHSKLQRAQEPQEKHEGGKIYKLHRKKKLLQATRFILPAEEEHLFNQWERSSLHLLEIIKFVSPSCLKTFAFMHFQMFHTTQTRKKCIFHSWSITKVWHSSLIFHLVQINPLTN